MTQTVDEEARRAEQEVPLLCANMAVVGIRHYRGVAHPGEYVNLVREPHNPYDSNAVRVDNMMGVQVGHIGRNFAAQLRPMLDGQLGSLHLEAYIPYAGNKWQLPCEVVVYGLPEQAQGVLQEARRHHMQFSRPGTAYGGGLGPGPGGGRPAMAVQRYDRQKSQAELEKLFDEMCDEDVSRLTVAQPPAVRTPLQPHQVVGVAWMLQREKNPGGSNGLPPFWELKKELGSTVYFNTITNSSHTSKPRPVAGGILADDMGLGKTIHVLALIASHPAPGVQYTPPLPAPATTEAAPSATAASLPVAEKEADLISMKRSELVGMARAVGAAVSGNKAALVARILQARATPWVPPAAPASSSADKAASNTRGTLVVVPLSVIYNWEQQVAEHYAPGVLSMYVYHGPDRIRSTNFLEKHDLVVTTYSTMLADFNERGGCTAGARPSAGGQLLKRKRADNDGVLGVSWRRLVLDEAHHIRNRATSTFKACCAVEAAFKWCLTGTPMQNGVNDVQALMAFLRSSPLDDFAIFNRAVGRPIRAGDPTGLSRLKVAMKAICLRRTKKDLKTALPEKAVELHTLQLDAAHQSVYDSLFNATRQVVMATMESGGDGAIMQVYASVLESILRLRQACLCTSLVPADRLKAAQQVLAAGSAKVTAGKALSVEEARKLFEALKGVLQPETGSEGAQNECCVCLEAVQGESARILRLCKHHFCAACLDRIASTSGLESRCPLCRQAFTASDVMALGELQSLSERRPPQDVEPELQPVAPVGSEPSPKVAALLHALTLVPDGEKAVVFSSFSSFLALIAAHLEAAGIGYCLLDGKTTSKARRERLAAFSDRPEKRVMLLSLKAGGVGLNLTCANHVFLMDLWWNVSVEEQAIDRVHRIGQRRPVKVVRYVCKGTVEERILEVQDRKAEASRALLCKQSADEVRQARVADIRHIFSA